MNNRARYSAKNPPTNGLGLELYRRFKPRLPNVIITVECKPRLPNVMLSTSSGFGLS
jgi:hypothetical protein